MSTIFIRLHDAEPERKPEALRDRIALQRQGGTVEDVFSVVTDEFTVIPRSPFAYWADVEIKRIFRDYAKLEDQGVTVRHGLSTKDDKRFLRLWWEVEPSTLQFDATPEQAVEHWVHLAKGGHYSPYYADTHLVVNWGTGEELKRWLESLYGGQHWSRDLRSIDCYFRPGLTWPRRTSSGISVRRLPAGCTFGDKGPVAFDDSDSLQRLDSLHAVLQSRIASELIATMLAAATAAARSYEVGIIQQLPVPHIASGRFPLIQDIHECAREPALIDEVDHHFCIPSLLHVHEATIIAGAESLDNAEQERHRWEAELQMRIDEEVSDLYGLSKNNRLSKGVGGIRNNPEASEGGSADLGEDSEDVEASPLEDVSHRVANLLMWCVGVAVGRWDVRMARDNSLVAKLQGPFERLPRIPPGGLIGPDGLPATPDRIASEAWLRARPNVIMLPVPGTFEGHDHITAADYPIEVAWDGILVDDPGHPRDIVTKVHEVLTYVFVSAERAQEIEAEALEILQAGGRTPRTLRDWFRSQRAKELGKNFFDFHIQRYSKSRRKAPIYWRLASNPGRGEAAYSIWLYYHRLTGDTLWQVLTQYVDPKRALEVRRLEDLRQARAAAEGAEKSRIEKEIEEKLALLEELDWFEGRLREVAERGYRPDLDDGVVINMAPLHEVVPWKEPETIWKDLEKGKYDWAKLAMEYWPERVREKCKEDKSLAIAHRVRG